MDSAASGVQKTYAAFRSVVSTAMANGASVLETVRFVLSAKRPEEVLAPVGRTITFGLTAK
jgi:hypothetical protein